MIYVIGDVHGCFKTLKALINKLPKNAQIVLVGDLMDRGPSSKDVIEFVINNNYDCVKGNHEVYYEEMITELLESKDIAKVIQKWYTYEGVGSKETLLSYDLYPITNTLNHDTRKLLQKHLCFVQNLPYYLEYKNYKTKDGRHLVVTHSHVNDCWELKEKHIDFYSNILNGRWNDFDNKEIFNVYGHTPVVKADITDYRANIDLGCVFKNAPASELLCALEFPSMKIFTQEHID